MSKQLEGQLAELNAKFEQATRDIQELTAAKSRLQAESADHTRLLEEAESQINQLTKAKQALTKQLEDAKAALEEESRLRAKLQSDLRNLQGDNDHLKEQLEEEQEGRGDLQRLLTKANNEVAVWRHKCESGEGGVRSEELDELKRKLNTKIQELESALEASQTKAAGLEKAKNRLQGELEDLTIEVERVNYHIFVYTTCMFASSFRLSLFPVYHRSAYSLYLLTVYLFYLLFYLFILLYLLVYV